MKYFSFEVFVVLAPAIVCAITGFVVEALPRLLDFIDREVYSSEKRVECLAEIFSHASFYGGAVGGALGFTNQAPLLFGIAAIWSFTCLYFRFALVLQLEEMENEKHEKEKVRFRKMAGMIRSVVRSEIARNASKNYGDNES